MKVTDLNYALENRLLKRLDKFADMVQRKKQIQDVLFCVNGLTGCLSGDTQINITRNEVGRHYKLKYLYNAFNGNGKLNHSGKGWDLSKTTYARSFDGKIIRLNKIKNVFSSGIKEVFKLTLENGLTIKATADHKFLTRENKWIELSNLKGKEIMCDTLNAKPSNRKRIRLRDIGLRAGKNHPYNIQPNKQIPVHVLIYEARLNNLDFLEYLDILLNEPERCKTLQFVNPKINTIHHKDGCHYNNSIDNLQLLKREEHYLEHNNYTNFSQGVPKFSNVLSIESVGREDTYDIECEDPNHNFVANGMVVHNSGKTNSALVMAYYLKWVTGRDIHLFFSTDKAANFLKETKEKIIVIDEPSLDSLSKDQATRTSKNFSRLMNTMRQKRHIVIVCVTRFWRFPIDLIVDRSLAMINMSNKGGKGIGRFQYIRQNKLETLWDNYQKYRKKDFAKLKSFGGGMPERMEKINSETGKPFFNSMGVVINGKLNCTYKDYKFFRDNEVKDIGVEKKSIKDTKTEQELARVRYVLACIAEEKGISCSQVAERFDISKGRISDWRQNGEKLGYRGGRVVFEVRSMPRIITSMDRVQKNPSIEGEAEASVKKRVDILPNQPKIKASN